MNMTEKLLALKKPFQADEIQWKIQVDYKDGNGLAAAYVDSRAIQERLDSVIGPLNWCNEYIRWYDVPQKETKSQLCVIAIKDLDTGEWIRKIDGAQASDFEPIKGGLSNSFRRAAVVWGIGRYLYQFPLKRIKIDKKQITQQSLRELEMDYPILISNIGLSLEDNSPPPDKTPKKPVQENGLVILNGASQILDVEEAAYKGNSFSILVLQYGNTKYKVLSQTTFIPNTSLSYAELKPRKDNEYILVNYKQAISNAA